MNAFGRMLVVVAAVVAGSFARPAESSAKEFSHPRPTVRSWRTEPSAFLAETADGEVYDKRTGNRIGSRLADATIRDAEATLERGLGGTGEAAFQGEHGSFAVQLLRAEASAEGRIGTSSASGRVQARAIVAGARVDYARQIGDDLNNARVFTAGEAMIGSEAEAGGAIGLSENGAVAELDAGAFAGGKVSGETGGSITLCGISNALKVTGNASYGIGAEARYAFELDWSTMTVRYGGRAALTAGLGIGAGVEHELSLEALLNDPKVAKECLERGLGKAAAFVRRRGVDLAEGLRILGEAGVRPLSRAVTAIRNAMSEPAAVSVLHLARFLDGPRRTGTQIERSASTRSGPSIASVPGAGIGMRR